jgi:hypothetical protein
LRLILDTAVSLVLRGRVSTDVQSARQNKEDNVRRIAVDCVCDTFTDKMLSVVSTVGAGLAQAV